MMTDFRKRLVMKGLLLGNQSFYSYNTTLLPGRCSQCTRPTAGDHAISFFFSVFVVLDYRCFSK